jgi:hypothetical protein
LNFNIVHIEKDPEMTRLTAEARRLSLGIREASPNFISFSGNKILSLTLIGIFELINDFDLTFRYQQSTRLDGDQKTHLEYPAVI